MVTPKLGTLSARLGSTHADVGQAEKLARPARGWHTTPAAVHASKRKNTLPSRLEACCLQPSCRPSQAKEASAGAQLLAQEHSRGRDRQQPKGGKDKTSPFWGH